MSSILFRDQKGNFFFEKYASKIIRRREKWERNRAVHCQLIIFSAFNQRKSAENMPLIFLPEALLQLPYNFLFQLMV